MLINGNQRSGSTINVRRCATDFTPLRLRTDTSLAEEKEDGKGVCVNTSGTFGLASAAFWRSRVAAAAVSGVHRVFGADMSVEMMLLVANDLDICSTQFHFRDPITSALVLLDVMGFRAWREQ